LLIDDSGVELNLLIEMMNGRNLRVHVAFDGQDGYNKAILIQPDLILLDIQMPKLDGIIACRWLKENPQTKEIPVIFISGHNEPEKRIDCLKMGAVDFINKPFHEEEVIARVQIHLSLNKRIQNLQQLGQTPTQSEVPDVPECSLINNLSRKDAMLVNAAMSYLRQRIDQPLRVEDLEKHIGCNQKRLTQAFKAGTGMTVFSWLREERLRQATDWLINTDTPILQIAESLGYSSQANFAKAFREHFGCSASAFRQKETPKQSEKN
jgi:YesN/AraC family two-component response regulator